MKWREEAKEKVERFVHFLRIFTKNKKILISLVTAVVLTAVIVSAIFIRSITSKQNQVSGKVKAGEKAQVSFKEAIVDIPKDTIKKDTTFNIKTVTPPKLTSPDLKYASQTYEFTSSQAKFDSPVVITLKYDLSKLPDPSYEDYLYIGVWENNQWVPLEGGIINKADRSLSAAVEHFTQYTALYNLKKQFGEGTEQAVKAWFEDKIESITYEQLPDDIAVDVDYSKSDIFSIQKVQVSLTTKASYFIEVVANAVSKASGILIGGQQSEKELQDALEEATASEIISGGGAVGEFTVKAYTLTEGGEVAYELATTGIQVAKGIKDAASLSVVYAKAISWILGVEMDYINKNIEPAFRDIWQLGSASKRLTLYIVYIDAPYKDNMYTKGMKYYYLDDKVGRHINYFNNLVSIKSEFKKTEGGPMEVTEFPPVYGGAEKVGKEFESPAADDKPLESCQAYGVKEADPGKIESWYKDKLLPLGWQLIYGDQLLEFRKQTDESFMVQVVGDYDWKTLPLFKEIPDKRELAEGEVGFLLCWSKQKAARETPTILPTMKVIPSMTPKVESKKITTVSEFEKLPDTGCYEKQIIPLVMHLKITQDLGNTLPGYGYNGQDETGTVSIGTLTEEKLLEVGKTYQLKGCKSNIGGGQGPGMPYFHLYTDQKDAIVEK